LNLRAFLCPFFSPLDGGDVNEVDREGEFLIRAVTFMVTALFVLNFRKGKRNVWI